MRAIHFKTENKIYLYEGRNWEVRLTISSCRFSSSDQLFYQLSYQDKSKTNFDDKKESEYILVRLSGKSTYGCNSNFKILYTKNVLACGFTRNEASNIMSLVVTNISSNTE